jgi:hypothetical protein
LQQYRKAGECISHLPVFSAAEHRSGAENGCAFYDHYTPIK